MANSRYSRYNCSSRHTACVLTPNTSTTCAKTQTVHPPAPGTPPHPSPSRPHILNAAALHAATRNGFGDVLFAYKLQTTLRRGAEWMRSSWQHTPLKPLRASPSMCTPSRASTLQTLPLEVRARRPGRGRQEGRRAEFAARTENELQALRQAGAAGERAAAVSKPALRSQSKLRSCTTTHDVNWEDFSAFVTCASTDPAPHPQTPGPTVRAPRGRAEATTINTINATQSTHRTRTTWT